MTDIPTGVPLAVQHDEHGPHYLAKLGGALVNGNYVGGQWTEVTEAEWRAACLRWRQRKDSGERD